jgi:hypothetical protein
MGYYHVISCTMYAARDGLRWQGAPKSIGSIRCSPIALSVGDLRIQPDLREPR